MSVYRVIFSPKTTRVICQSIFDANTLVDNNILPRHKVVMTEGSGVAIPKYEGYRAKRRACNNSVLRRLLPEGVKEFPSCCWCTQEMLVFEVEFYLAGPIDPESPGALSEEQVVKLCDSNSVKFLGYRDDLQDVLAETHIFVLPSYYAEGVPKVLLEAAASGCAVITTDHPGCRDAIVSEETGLLVKPKDVFPIDRLTRLLSNRDLMESMG